MESRSVYGKIGKVIMFGGLGMIGTAVIAAFFMESPKAVLAALSVAVIVTLLLIAAGIAGQRVAEVEETLAREVKPRRRRRKKMKRKVPKKNVSFRNINRREVKNGRSDRES